MYDDLIEMNNVIREWQKLNLKEKSELLYDFDGCCYGNMTTNKNKVALMAKIFNNILKCICGNFIMVIVRSHIGG